jgi:hypothetical protein
MGVVTGEIPRLLVSGVLVSDMGSTALMSEDREMRKKEWKRRQDSTS